MKLKQLLCISLAALLTVSSMPYSALAADPGGQRVLVEAAAPVEEDFLAEEERFAEEAVDATSSLSAVETEADAESESGTDTDDPAGAIEADASAAETEDPETGTETGPESDETGGADATADIEAGNSSNAEDASSSAEAEAAAPGDAEDHSAEDASREDGENDSGEGQPGNNSTGEDVSLDEEAHSTIEKKDSRKESSAEQDSGETHFSEEEEEAADASSLPSDTAEESHTVPETDSSSGSIPDPVPDSSNNGDPEDDPENFIDADPGGRIEDDTDSLPVNPEDILQLPGANAQEETITEDAAMAGAQGGTCGDHLDWSLDDEGTLTISGTGEMTDFSSNLPWDVNSIRTVVIGSGVTRIGDSAFEGCVNLTNVSIPESVTSIGIYAFSSCTSLTVVEIPENVKEIGYEAFGGCTGLTNVAVPERLARTYKTAFKNTPWLDAFLDSLPEADGFKTLDEILMVYTGSRSEITIPDGISIIGDEAFLENDSLISVTIPEGVTAIGKYAFSDCSSLTNITIPAGVTEIGEGVFFECISLAAAVIPEGVTVIEDGLFWDCRSLASVTIPVGMTLIGDGAFYSCKSLTDVVVPDGVVEIAEAVFFFCESLKGVTIPASVNSIGDLAFYGCPDGLTIRGYGGSKAERYAYAHDFAFVDLNPKSIADATVKAADQTYTGKALSPAPKVELDGITLQKGVDYTVSYANNINAGTAAVTVTGIGNYAGTASCEFTIKKAAASLSFAKSAVTKKSTDSAFTNTLTKKTDGKITFSSSNTAVASVAASSGKVTIKKAGKATITAKAAAGKNYKAASASYTLTVQDVGVNGIPKTCRLGVGQKYTFKPTVKNVTYTVTDAKVAAVSAKGVMTAKKAGTATVKVYSSKKLAASCKVTVLAAPGSVKPGTSAVKLGVSETFTLSPVIPANTWTTFTYASKNASVATVTSKGVIKGVKTGKTTITISTHNGKKANVAVTVVNAPSKVTLSQTSLTLGAKETFALKPVIPSGTHTSMTYISGDTGVATVSAKGVVKGVKAGATTVTVKTHNGKKASVAVTVMNAPSKVSFSDAGLSIGIKETCTLVPVIPAKTHTTFTYASDNAKVATVSADGVLTGVKAGTATVTVTTHNGKTASLSVTVKKAPSKVTMSKSRLLMNTDGTFQLKAVLPENTASAITWKSSNAGIVAVDKNGKLTAKATGAAKITATTFNKKSASCAVLVSDDFVFSGRTLIQYKGEGTAVSIPAVNTEGNTVLAIGESVFEGNTAITEVSIPNTVRTIGSSAFKDCTALEKITFPQKLQTIGEQAFDGDTSLKTLKIPFGTAQIGPQAFARSGIEEIYFPDTVDSIAEDAFDGLPDVILHAPAGSYAKQYAESHDYLCEGNDIQYNKEEYQRQLDLLEELEELENDPDEETMPIGEWEFPMLDSEGIEDPELLAFIDEVNASQETAKKAYDSFLVSTASFAEAFNSLCDEADAFSLDVSDDGISMECEGYSYSIRGDCFDSLGEDFEIISAEETDDEEALKLEIESGGKRYYLIEDDDGITLYPKENGVTESPDADVITADPSAGAVINDLETEHAALSAKAAAQMTEGKLRTFLSYVQTIFDYILTKSDAVGDAIKVWLNSAVIDVESDTIVLGAHEDHLQYAEARIAALSKATLDEEGKKTLRGWMAKADELKNIIKNSTEKLARSRKFLSFAKGANALWSAFNVEEDIRTYVTDLIRLDEVIKIQNHGHPTSEDSGSQTRLQFANEVVQNINKCYWAIGSEAVTSALSAGNSLLNLITAIEILAAPFTEGMSLAGIPLSLLGKASIKLTMMTFVKAAGIFLVRAGINYSSEHYYKVVKNADDQLHGYVGGTVTDDDTGKPIPRVKVSCEGAFTYTDSKGKYAIKVGLGEQTVKFEKQGYNRREYLVHPELYESKPLDITMLSNGDVSGHVRDAQTGEPLEGVTVTYGGYATVTDEEGFYKFTVKKGTEDMSFSKEDYITVHKYGVTAECDKTIVRDAVLTRKLEDDQFRAVLTWGSTPKDLDSHLVGPDYHVYYQAKTGTNAELDTDDTDSYGPETVTFKIEPGGTYRYYVYDYTNGTDENVLICSDLARSGATVAVYQGNEQIGIFSVPSGPGFYWEVFTIRDGEFTLTNTIH